MNQAARIQKISEVTGRQVQPHGIIDIPWEEKLVPMKVYLIPLAYLIYNKYNGRILSRTKSLESQGHDIDPETEEGKRKLEGLLMDSNTSRNKQTLESLKRIGQEKVGIITRDGIIIDGNRRAMLLNQAGKEYFKTVVLEVTLDENPLEIEKLETTYQMGEDEKLGYNAIEKYLKAKGLNQRGVSVEKIASWMGETVGTVEQYLEVMGTMDDYLDYLGYNGVYTQLDGREDLFINLTKWLKGFYGEGSGKAFDGYRNGDVDDLKNIAFDYIRAKFEGKEFRLIADGLKTNHFFGEKGLWSSFRDTHFAKIKAVYDAEGPVKLDSEDLKATLDARDDKFFERTKDAEGRSFLKENLEDHRQQLRYRQISNEPLKLASGAFDALDAIDFSKNKASSAPEVLSRIEDINRKTFDVLKSKSPEQVLSRVIEMLESISSGAGITDKEESLERVKEISHMAYQLEKDLKKS